MELPYTSYKQTDIQPTPPSPRQQRHLLSIEHYNTRSKSRVAGGAILYFMLREDKNKTNTRQKQDKKQNQ